MVISGGDSKRDTLAWYHATVQLAKTGMLHHLDAEATESTARTHRREDLEALEESRRLFWLIYSMDRHWSLSYNSVPLLHDQDCLVYVPLPDDIWLSEDLTEMQLASGRMYGPQLHISGLGFFQWFLPLMVALGDIVWTRNQLAHPRLHTAVRADIVGSIQRMLDRLLQSIEQVDDGRATTFVPHSQPLVSSPSRTSAVGRLYARFIIHVLFVLLHGRWDALDLLQRNSSGDSVGDERSPPYLNPVRCPLSDWITSEHFALCSSHAISASDTLAEILRSDPELSLIPYLFGIYLLHGSFMLLFFADRMLEVGGTTNLSVNTACETVIRAHEASFTTLSVDFQRNFRKVLRATLEEVRVHQTEPGRASSTTADSRPELWREILGLYRWSSGFQGLAI